MPSKKGEEIVLLDEVEKALLDPAAKLSVVENEDAEAVQRSIIMSILESSDPLHRAETLGGRDLIGVPLRVKSVSWRNSDFEGEGLGIFAVMNAPVKTVRRWSSPPESVTSWPSSTGWPRTATSPSMLRSASRRRGLVTRSCGWRRPSGKPAGSELET